MSNIHQTNIRNTRKRTRGVDSRCTSGLAEMMEQAYRVGYSEVKKDYQLGQSSRLAVAYASFLSENPDLAEEMGLMSNESGVVDFPRDVFEPALNELPPLVGYRFAKLINVYKRYYSESDEGTGLHNDLDTGADLVVVRTMYGEADFTCEGIDVPDLVETVTSGDVVAFRADMHHSAGSPVGGPRSIEGWAVKLV